MQNDKMIIISLGGSLIVPEEIDCAFVKDFKQVIEEKITEGYRFIIITGGGKICRKYQQAASEITDIDNEDKDWLGIHATRMNAHFMRTIFRKHAHPTITKNPYDLEGFLKAKEPILIASGYRPGNSTDYIAVLLARQFGSKKIANLSNIDYVCDKDPRTNPDAKQIKNVSWPEFQSIVGDKWDPGANVPFDPIASKMAAQEGMEVVIMNGKNIENFKKYLNGEDFKGTVIR
jgi:uridylate kinase